MVELRKRKIRTQSPAPEKRKKTASTAVNRSRQTAKTNDDTSHGNLSSKGLPQVGDTISLDGFGGELEKNDGGKVTLRSLLDESKSGVVLFTYPRASTPGCTKQACLFRDNHDHLTSTGFSIYGLSTDSPKANTTFQTKQSLPYPLLCDVHATLIAAIGMKKLPKGTTRGVFAIDKNGKVLLSKAGGPDATVEAVQKLVDGVLNGNDL
ncbi:hypothetical protein ASPZODRAFT_58689 [Penicilliopsis zonata CBS 506.65]|uniref:thioredoxin-dependent peroxiredoxin n=1 Tax=Penicilliopsis zonata CBS 506.65 TaxID=1073090 RepID=A0A1L9SQY0_9EURO|nr:hypothetical protein ASPZODRAFT_58689 [Penicilliopsis zonata CBS 506.65]OJJ49504.1 hypothetical protein ASPZODRAFT_58689 [Penicilliopsis zonata CBS 506.65]